MEWSDGKVRFIDQRMLPRDERMVETDDPAVVEEAIRTLAIRGAPLIGIAAAYAVVLAAQRSLADIPARFSVHLERAFTRLAGTRPTAVNLFWSLDRMRKASLAPDAKPEGLVELLLAEARAIHNEDRDMCSRIGAAGAELLPPAAAVLTHCNTGSLATGGDGTALNVIRVAWQQHKLKHVYVDETRPLFQGSRLTTWELRRLDIPHTL
ncbi:MAG: S-methyl-5-thioribose-1-phosphate isomerase, partial [Bacteroidota bacterium]